MSDQPDIKNRVAEMERVLNERLAAMQTSEQELALKEAALSEANDIALKATTLMHHFRGQAEALQKQCADLASSSASDAQSSAQHEGRPPLISSLSGPAFASSSGAPLSTISSLPPSVHDVAPAWTQDVLPSSLSMSTPVRGRQTRQA